MMKMKLSILFIVSTGLLVAVTLGGPNVLPPI